MPEASAVQTRRALALLWLIPAMWAVNFVVARKAPGVIGPYMLALGRWAVAGICLSVAAYPELWRHRSHIAAAWWQYLVLGTFGMLICGAWVYQGAHSTSAMNMALIYSTSPIFIALGAVCWLGERFSLRQAAGVLLAIAGVIHVVVKGQWMALASVAFTPGDLWMVAATFAWAAYALLQKKWTSPLGATARLAAICVGGVLVLIPFTVWEALQPGSPVLGSHAALLIAIVGIIPGLAAYLIYGWSQKILGASRVAVVLYLGPLYTGIAAWFFGEPPGWHHLAGALFILPGVFLVTGRPAEKQVVLEAAPQS